MTHHTAIKAGLKCTLDDSFGQLPRKVMEIYVENHHTLASTGNRAFDGDAKFIDVRIA